MFVDYILNGEGYGEVGATLNSCRFDLGLLRPYLDEKGRKCVTVNTGRMEYDKDKGDYSPVYEKRLVSELTQNGIDSPVFNSMALRKDQWIRLDQTVLKAARRRLRAWADLASANTYGGFNGMARTVLEHETMSDPGEAIMDMDGLTQGRGDSPRFQLEGLPLPITHSDFYFSSRRLATARNMGTPLDTTMAEAAGRRVAEMIEKVTIGVTTGPAFGDSTNYGRTAKVYGYTNFPDRIDATGTLTTPTGSNPQDTVDDVLRLRDLLYDARYYGPYMLYTSKDWDRYLDNDYFVLETSGATAPARTLRSRLREIEGIQDVRRLDFLTGTFNMVMVQMTEDVARAVNGMDITTVQWESQGGLRLNFKVMAIHVPQLRADFEGRCGIVHAST